MAKRESKKGKTGAGHHRKMGEDFLIANAKKEAVHVTDSGLQYTIVEEGAGEKMPDEYATVLIHQRVQLLDGKMLGDTYKKNEPEEVALAEMIEGLQEGLQMMSVGARYKFWVPADLAWGRKGTSNKIPPYAVLAFDIRLLEVL